MHYYKRNLGDYAKKAGKLSMLQHGAYTVLIDACYDREKFPTLEEAIDWAWASTSAEIEAVEFVLRKFFELVDGRYMQPRIQEEIDTYQRNCETNSRIATEREAKRNRTFTKREPIVNEPPPNHKPRTINQEPLTKTKTTVAEAPAGCADDIPPTEPLIPETKPKTKSDAEDQVHAVFSHWQKAMGHERAQLDAKRSKAIKMRLKDGYSVADLCLAVDGCLKSPYHMGDNDNRTVYDDIELICRDGPKVDAFIKKAQVQPELSPKLQRQAAILKDWI